jgi:hypothetical protein
MGEPEKYRAVEKERAEEEEEEEEKGGNPAIR